MGRVLRLPPAPAGRLALPRPSSNQHQMWVMMEYGQGVYLSGVRSGIAEGGGNVVQAQVLEDLFL